MTNGGYLSWLAFASWITRYEPCTSLRNPRLMEPWSAVRFKDAGRWYRGGHA